MRTSLLAFFTSLFLCSLQYEIQAQTTFSSIEDAIIVYQEDYGALSRKYFVVNSEQYFTRFDEFYTQWLSYLDEINFQELAHPDKVDFLLFKNDLERSLYFLQADSQRFNEVSERIPAKTGMMKFITERRSGTSMDGKEAATRFNKWHLETTILLGRVNTKCCIFGYEFIQRTI